MCACLLQFPEFVTHFFRRYLGQPLGVHLQHQLGILQEMYHPMQVAKWRQVFFLKLLFKSSIALKKNKNYYIIIIF